MKSDSVRGDLAPGILYGVSMGQQIPSFPASKLLSPRAITPRALVSCLGKESSDLTRAPRCKEKGHLWVWPFPEATRLHDPTLSLKEAALSTYDSLLILPPGS